MIRRLFSSQYVFAVGGWVLAAALLPTVVGAPLGFALTAGVTGTVLTSYAASFVAQGQPQAAWAVQINGLLWLVILAQEIGA